MSTLKVAAAQLGPASPAKSDTINRIIALIDQAGAAGVEFVVFPELALSPYFANRVRPFEEADAFAETAFPSAETQPVIEAIKRNKLTAVIPFAEKTPEGLYNSAALIGPDGQELGRYRKMHIPGTVEPDPDRKRQGFEKRYFQQGDLGFPAYQSQVGNVGMAICYDRRFPETFRCLGLSGSEIYAVVFNTGYDEDAADGLQKSIEAHELAVRSAALYNGIPAIASGKAGVEEGKGYIGASSVISHTGEVLARSASDGDDLVVAVLDLDAAAAARARLGHDVNRRPDEYVAITQEYALASA
jgi:predicted amidohydrolase